MTEIYPLKARLLIEPIEEENITAGGIALPETAKGKPKRGTVMRIGENVNPIKVGDEALFSPYSGTEIEMDGKKYLILDESDILATLKKGK